MDTVLKHAVDIRVLPNDREAERFLENILRNRNCIDASYRRLQSLEADLKAIEEYSKVEDDNARRTTEFCRRLTEFGIPIYIFEWSVM
ncbi:MAG: hypothetical protein AAGA75_27975 [Cyanobacteria bacterium P01_E01_bin.6]